MLLNTNIRLVLASRRVTWCSDKIDPPEYLSSNSYTRYDDTYSLYNLVSYLLYLSKNQKKFLTVSSYLLCADCRTGFTLDIFFAYFTADWALLLNCLSFLWHSRAVGFIFQSEAAFLSIYFGRLSKFYGQNSIGGFRGDQIFFGWLWNLFISHC